MATTKIITVVGARPQFIKAAVVSRALRAVSNAEEKIIHTGQHFDANMSDIFFDELDIPKPHFHLGVGGGSHAQNTGRMLEKIEAVLMEEKPAVVLVYGDTDSTLAATLAAVKLHIPIAHVEAGLRSFNRKMPEEINRVLTDHASELLFTPTQTAVKNLLKEGIDQSKIKEAGDVMLDAALYYGAKVENSSSILQQLGLTSKQFALATLHRAENVDNKQRLSSILDGLKHYHHTIIWPLHPRTKKKLEDFGISIPQNIKVIDPVGYLDMIMLEKHAALITTDSGGVQKEAYFHKVPCITVRDETEWVELVTQGANIITGADTEKIVAALNNAANTPPAIFNEPLYGDGNTGKYIVDTLLQYFKR
jgi:UDP-GlcNAc3NAcA epimerase